MAKQRGFSRADFSSDHSEPSVVHHAEFEHGESHAVHVAPIDQIGVRQDRKGLLAKPIIRLVHQNSLVLLPNFPDHLVRDGTWPYQNAPGRDHLAVFPDTRSAILKFESYPTFLSLGPKAE